MLLKTFLCATLIFSPSLLLGQEGEGESNDSGYYICTEEDRERIQWLAAYGEVSPMYQDFLNNYVGEETPVYIEEPYDRTVWDAPQRYISIGGYWANLVEGSDQWIVDAEGTAAMFSRNGKTIIADHAHQGFKEFRWNDRATISGTTYKKVSQYNGINNGDIILNDGRNFADVYDGDLIMYTCVGSGDDVVVSYWQPSGWEQETTAYAPTTNDNIPETKSAETIKSEEINEKPTKKLTSNQVKHIKEKVRLLNEEH